MSSTSLVSDLSISAVDNFVSGDIDGDDNIEVVLLSPGNIIRVIDATNNFENSVSQQWYILTLILLFCLQFNRQFNYSLLIQLLIF